MFIILVYFINKPARVLVPNIHTNNNNNLYSCQENDHIDIDKANTIE